MTSGDAITVWMFEQGGPEGTQPLVLTGYDAFCTVLVFHPRDCMLISGSDDTRVMIWAPQRRTAPGRLGFLDDTVTGVAWPLPGRFIISTDAVGTVRAWGLEEQRRCTSLGRIHFAT